MKKKFWDKTRKWAAMIKIEHSVFALPFAYMGAFWAAQGWPGWKVFFFLTLAMVAVRSFAMTFNRIADLEYDRENSRTKNRPLVTGEIALKDAYFFLGITAVLFIVSCAFLNVLCFFLSFPALAWSAFYSYTKRFTSSCHFFLGSVLGLAPLAGWIAYDPSFNLVPFLLFLGVLFWVAGFDILYSSQDVGFDQEKKLHSIPGRHGLRTAFALAGFSHLNAALFFGLAGIAAGASWPYFAAWMIVSGVLFAEHRIISPDNLHRLNVSFFTLNGVVAVILLAGVLADIAVA
ncbi:4-hydroxybenzoate octaprenyltransferase [Desulfonatronovibrio hydrogenovorans]|uniref:4-hydroxybenzoate octaprenyltransferase n=1 Tax=Desulfonatronovibrio hydrogenovorans TaxID=53245 RepID=UPI00048F953B|nr:4-hydroxybenzoate octaprenyltransferase [Desulfonatronovibrio hydrogenovorans]